jgi:nucleoside-diphosphate-sugar epimerase
VGSGQEISISDLGKMVAKIVGFDGKIIFNSKMPDGTPRKLLDISMLTSFGWYPKIELCQGIQETYKWFLDQENA